MSEIMSIAHRALQHAYRDEIKFLSIDDVVERVSLSRSTIYRQIQHGTFPKPHKISNGRVGWVNQQVTKWIHTQISNVGDSTDQDVEEEEGGDDA